METVSLPQLASDLLEQARTAPSGRAASTLHPVVGGRLRQTAIALTAGTSMSDHESPGEATLHVLRGTVSIGWSGGSLDLMTGDIAAIPAQRHGLDATDDAVVLLTVALAQ